MHALTRMRYSRNDWKEKATSRAEVIREYRKKVAKKDRKIAELEEKLSQIGRVSAAEKKSFLTTSSSGR